MTQYNQKLLCESCSKPIGEVWTITEQADLHKPYINYRKWGNREICNICLSEAERKQKQQRAY